MEKIIRRTLAVKNVAEGEVGILFVSDARIKSLNRRYLKRPWPTDVLAFGMGGGGRPEGSEKLIGEIVVSVDRARVQARKFGNSLKKELALYLIHGTLHLLGYKDGSREIEKTQQAVLNMFF